MYCPHCGTLNEPGAVRCTKCTAVIAPPEKKSFWKQLYRPGQGLGCLLIIAALAVSSLFFIIPQYRLYKMQVDTQAALARESVLKNNLRQMRVALDQMAVEYGSYPVSLVPENAEKEDPGLGYVASVARQLRNPFDPQVPAVAESQDDPPDWNSFKPGQIVYVPLDIRENRASGYAIFGMGKKGLLPEVMRGRF
jgi:hypothetical protein